VDSNQLILPLSETETKKQTVEISKSYLSQIKDISIAHQSRNPRTADHTHQTANR